MNILVIGGSGFIGTRLVARLVEASHAVSIVDVNKSEAFPDLWVYGDVADYQSLAKAVNAAGGKFDVVVNLAAEHKDNVRPVEKYYQVNVDGAKNLVKLLGEYEISSLVFTSTVAVYGFLKEEADENFEIRPFNDYGKSKAMAEEVYRAWQRKQPGARTLVTVRPTVVFGEGNRGNVFNLLRQLSSGKFVMVGNGENRKSMAYVGNVAAFIEYCLNSSAGEYVFNYADKPDFNMNNLVALVKNNLGNKRATPRLPYGLGLFLGYCADLFSLVTKVELPISSIRVKKFCANTLYRSNTVGVGDFEPPFSLRKALERTIVYEFKT